MKITTAKILKENPSVTYVDAVIYCGDILVTEISGELKDLFNICIDYMERPVFWYHIDSESVVVEIDVMEG